MRSMRHAKMYLHSGDMKTEPVDPHSRDKNELEQIKCEPTSDDADHVQKIQNTGQTSRIARQTKSKVSNLRNSLRKHPDELKKRKHLEQRDNPTNQQTYCCLCCGKKFDFHCRLKSHMPVHTNDRQYKCTQCSKRYKNLSSLHSHINKSHLGKACRARAKSSVAGKTKSKQIAVETQKMQLQKDDIKMKPLDKVEMEWAPLSIDANVHWVESDLNLILPTASIDGMHDDILELNRTDDKVKVNESCNPMSTNHIIIHRSKVENLLTTKLKPLKCEIWKKETDDPLACHVDILQTPKPTLKQRPPTLRLEKTTDQAAVIDNSIEGSKKNTELANRFNGFGDDEFRLRNWSGAWHWYNRTLCHAERNFSSVYAKRAKCYFNEGLYQACWTDLALAENFGGSCEALPLAQVEHLKKSCTALMNAMHGTQNARFEPMLSHPFDPMFPEMAAVLQIDCNEYFGRHIRARQSIAVGATLIIETGFVATSTAYYDRCCICLTSDLNLIPCTRCTKAMLCKNCKHSHQTECELQTALKLQYPWVTKVLRSFLNAINLFTTIDEMMEFVGDAISSWRKMQPITPIVDQRSKYRAFLQLITVPTIQPVLNGFVSKLHAVLLHHPTIGLKFQTLKSQRFLAHLLIHHICVVNEFTVKVGSADNNAVEECLDIVAPITCYLKHSCAPNVSKFLLGQSVVVVAMRPIQPGEPLFVSYCDILAHRNDRQRILQMEYGFHCSCERCSSAANFPSNERPAHDEYHFDAFSEFVRKNFAYLTSNDQVKRKEISEHIVDILQRYGRMQWNRTITWAYVIFSLLLSQRFQKKLQY